MTDIDLRPSRSESSAKWRHATTLQDLAALTAQWFDGWSDDHPGHWGPPDAETAPLRTVLAAINRAGLLTISSQPSTVVIDNPQRGLLVQRAALEALTDRGTAEEVVLAAAEVPWLHCHVDDPHNRRRWRTDHSLAVPVTVWRQVGTPPAESVTDFGSALSRRDLSACFPGCRRARRALDGAYQVTLVDRDWPDTGSDPGRLWDWLIDTFTLTNQPGDGGREVS